MKKFLCVLVSAITIFCACSCSQAPQTDFDSALSDPQLSVWFFDVGQGDSILIGCENEYMLVDAGTNESGKTVVDFLKTQGVKSLKYAVGTHPHADHIGGLDDVLDSVKTSNLIMPDVTADTAVFSDVLDSVERQNLSVTVPGQGDKFSVGDAEITLLSDTDKNYGDELNNYSLVLKLVYRGFSLVLTGDAETEAEEDILESGQDISADVLKLGHHGSRTSTSNRFLNAVSPRSAVISCGKDNDYGHPHFETLEKLEKSQIEVYRTDLSGTLLLTSDGKNGFEISPQFSQKTFADSEIQVEHENSSSSDRQNHNYILNTKSKKFHNIDCKSADGIYTKNRKDFYGSRDQLISQGYSPCSVCNP